MRQDIWTRVEPHEIGPHDPHAKAPAPRSSWQLLINPDHVGTWIGLGLWWLCFVAFALVAGWHLGPRPDEVVFVLTLPLWMVLAPYVVFCLLATAMKAWLIPILPVRWQLWAISRSPMPPAVGGTGIKDGSRAAPRGGARSFHAKSQRGRRAGPGPRSD